MQSFDIGHVLHRIKTALQTHDDQIKNEQDRLQAEYHLRGGISGLNAQTLARQATLHPHYTDAQMHANLLALMKHLGYVPYQSR